MTEIIGAHVIFYNYIIQCVLYVYVIIYIHKLFPIAIREANRERETANLMIAHVF